METNTRNHLIVKTWKLILAILLVNAIGLSLRYLNINTYIIIFGFRFHLSLVLPFLIVFNSSLIPYIKSSFLKPEFIKGYYYLIIMFLPIVIELGGLFLLQKIDLGDPEYFYEFGLSSVADYPIYLIWNLPQLFLLFFFLSCVSAVSKFRFISVAVVIFLLFVFELVPINRSIIQFGEIGTLAACSVIYSLLINYYRNVYWFVISLFTLFWIAILAFGSNSKALINILFAGQYNNWEGFFDVAKQYAPFTLPVHFAIALIVSCFVLIFTKQKTNY